MAPSPDFLKCWRPKAKKQALGAPQNLKDRPSCKNNSNNVNNNLNGIHKNNIDDISNQELNASSTNDTSWRDYKKRILLLEDAAAVISKPNSNKPTVQMDLAV